MTAVPGVLVLALLRLRRGSLLELADSKLERSELGLSLEGVGERCLRFLAGRWAWSCRACRCSAVCSTHCRITEGWESVGFPVHRGVEVLWLSMV